VKAVTVAKHWVRKLAHTVGLHHLASPLLSGIGIIFTSHRIIAPGEIVLDPSQAVAASHLVQCLETVRRRGYDIVSLDQVHDRLVYPGSRGRRFVCFTFDDGYRDNLTLGLPIFRRFEAPMNVYVTTGLPDRTLFYWWRGLERVVLRHECIELAGDGVLSRMNTRTLTEKRATYSRLCRFFSPRSRHDLARGFMAQHGVDPDGLLEEDTLSWAELSWLARDGLVTIGAHTITHPVLSELDEASARREIAGGRARLEERLGKRVEHLAFPFGNAAACHHREFELARRAGYKTATTTQVCNIFPDHDRDLWSLPRISLDDTADQPSAIDQHLSGVTALFRMRLQHPAISGRFETGAP
jgi:peptidoglycan/xylan/chitin deacetylase (PgdA/CDA1 family)